LPPFVQALPTYGRNLISTLPAAWFDRGLVLCAPEPWEFAKSAFPVKPLAAVVPASMEQSLLEAQIDALPAAGTVFGIGGGSACDAAKMYAWRRGARLVLVPTILSVDAPFTKAIGVRVDHRVRYVGEVFPERLLIDFDLLRKSPPRLNRAGIGDVLSIFTALYDWRLAARETGEAFDPAIAAASRALLDRLFLGSDEIRECTEQGLQLIGDLYVGEVALCEAMKNSRPEEGSEHYLAYCLESLTRKSYIHGELIACTVLLTSLCQEQAVDEVLEFLDRVGVEFRPGLLNVSYEELEKALVELPAYLKEERQLPYGIFHHRGMDAKTARRLLEKFRSVIDETRVLSLGS